MFKSLFKLYAMVVLAAALALVAVNKSFVLLFHDTLTHGERELRKGYAFALREYLDRAGDAREAAIARLNDNAWERFDVVDPAAVPALSAQQRRDLAQDKLVLLTNGKDYYLPLRDGAVLHAHADDIDYSHIKAMAYGLIAIAALLPLMLWVWSHWRDLRTLEEAARAFGAGRLSTRANLRKRSNVYALARQFDDMAERIQGSIQHQREMMNGISHELKTPIARLEFGIALLQSPLSDDQRAVRVDALRRDVRELDELVTELLALSRLEQGATHLVLMRVAVGEWLDSVVGSVANDVADRQLALVVHADAAPTHHVCDPRLVARALLNLIRNAARYAQHTIIIRAEAGPAGALCLTVEDDGPGIPPADRARVFEPFLRLDASRDRHTGGFGLGLAIVRRIALVHGGEVHLDAAPGGGARFAVQLPAMAMPLI
ncbi:ATP-binding protein [Ralstonia mannitolilytica]|uniref:histidine kinase n=1 Tax=Ralstonia mannitolilytica TaxID=105219 RepID=A0AAJ5D6K9_9RALS|nr:ATP-binding protein [Ralstonia mannitolilytica]CAG2152790.1 Adaptive-response sensory-kinase SasA [Ralstonia mannitolilytica]CAJ0731823.1 Adaptive-response sensory-kinase SasA [Ralstonia mannitolilytica]SUD89100.1 Sensor protein RstB [Ralstonia mannitolilytica]SUD95063.1 Sensor protein RstB [Ralstonia mannitolilytica]SUD98589.1 Sensor protein RstB [Ralstonia mannitolilytica]